MNPERVWCVTNRLGTLVTRRNGKTAVVGNCIGRIHRDGQEDPVVAYFLVSDHGSDPIMLDVLGVKAQQLSGLINPNGELVQTNELQEQYIRELAKSFLQKNGVSIDEESNTTDIASNDVPGNFSGMERESQSNFSIRGDVGEHEEGLVDLPEGSSVADQGVQSNGE
jgi:hypothetical protein